MFWGPNDGGLCHAPGLHIVGMWRGPTRSVSRLEHHNASHIVSSHTHFNCAIERVAEQ
jgi:hypothetical protein